MTETQLSKESKNDLRSILAGDKFREQIALSLPAHMKPERFARIALTALTRTPKLMECTKESVLKCCMELSSFGLEPDGRRAHLIPYGKECTLILDWKALVELAKRSGQVKSWRAEKVCDNDKFSYINGVVSHEIDFRKPRGNAYCFYSDITLADGTHDYEVLHMDDINFIKSKSRAASSGPWKDFPDEMAKKSCIRRHSKRITLSPEFHDALDKDHDRYDDIRTVRNVTPAPPVPNILPAGPIVEEKKPGPAAQFWLWCESHNFAPKDVYRWLVANNHVGSADDELSDSEVEKINRDELSASMP